MELLVKFFLKVTNFNYFNLCTTYDNRWTSRLGGTLDRIFTLR